MRPLSTYTVWTDKAYNAPIMLSVLGLFGFAHPNAVTGPGNC